MTTFSSRGGRVRFVFEAFRRDAAGELTLLHRATEECHVDQIERRAAALLWHTALPEVQELVLVRKAETGHIVCRRSTGTSRHAWPEATRRSAGGR